jgi:hypothetical protein
MTGHPWTDIRMIEDGSLRWVWLAMCGEHVCKAGIARTKDIAQGHAQRAVERLMREQRGREREQSMSKFMEPTIDFDAVERGPEGS